MSSKFLYALLGGAFLCTPHGAHAQEAAAQDAPGVYTSDTIIVTARRNPEDPPVVAEARARLSRTPGAVSVVSNESYEQRAAQGLSDLLRDTPGVLAEKRYGEESRFSIRGSGLDQSYHQRGVLLAQDGVPFADADGFSDFQKLDPLTARYVEVYRGGNALRFGGAQLGGAVNLVTPTGRTAESPNLLRVEGGSFGLMREAGQFARTAGPWDGFLALSHLEADGYRDHSAQVQSRGTANIGYDFGADRAVRVTLYGAEIHQEVPGTLDLAAALSTPRAAGAGVVATDWRRNQRVFRASAQTHWRLSGSTVFEGGLYATTTDLFHPISLLIDQQIETQGAFGRFDWTGDLGGHKADLYYGLSYRQGHVDQILAPVFFPVAGDSRQKATGLDLFAEGRWFATEHLALVAGGSYGRATRDYTDHLDAANDASKTFDWFAPRVGLLWQADNGAQIYANVTRSVEPPHYGALVQAPYPGFVPVVPQEAWTGEIGARGRVHNLIWDVTLYRSRIDHELLSFNAAAGMPAAFFNAGKTIHQGVEAALDWTILDDLAGGALSLRQTYTFSDFTFDGDPTYGDGRLPVMPPQQYRATLKYARRAGWFAAASLEWRPQSVYVDYANTLKAPGFAIWSLNAGWDFASGVSLFLDARNLGDTIYAPEFAAVPDARAPGANLAVFYPGEGRSVYGGIAYRF